MSLIAVRPLSHGIKVLIPLAWAVAITTSTLPAGAVADPLFGPVASYGTTHHPRYVDVGDFNGDGAPDLATSNTNEETISVLFNQGNGTFGQPLLIDTKPQFGFGGLSKIKVGDLNGDKKLDIAVCGYGQSRVIIYPGNGKGKFGNPIYPRTGTSPYCLALADLNGDGRLDIVTGNSNPPSASVLLARGGPGNFADPVNYALSSNPGEVQAGDLNGDGRIDLVFGQETATGSVLLGNGDGTFASPVEFVTAGGFNQVTSAMALSDLNGDHSLDLAIAETGFTTGCSAVLLGNGGGGFGSPSPFQCFSNADGLAARDLNGDGKVDLATVWAHCLFVYFGNGDGTFTIWSEDGCNVVAGCSTGLASGDFNLDGRPDLVIADWCNSQVSVLLNTGPASSRPAALRPDVNVKPMSLESFVSPHPVRESATLRFAVGKAGPVSIRLFDASGRLVRTMRNKQWAEPGVVELRLDRQGLPPGIYLYRIDTSGGATSGRLVVMN